MATVGSRRALSTPVDLNRVRLQALLGAADDTLRRLPDQAFTPPDWLDAQRRTCWAFAFGRAHYMLEDALRQADAAPRHDARRVAVSGWAMVGCEPVSTHRGERRS